jgi:hypothetical protein
VAHSQGGFQLFIRSILDTLNLHAATAVSIGALTPLCVQGAQLNPFLFLEHLELVYGAVGASTDSFVNYGAAMAPALVDSFKSALISNPLLTLLGLLNYLSLAAALSLAFLVTSGLSNKSEWATDAEHVVSTISTEAEKELFSLDDAVYLAGIMCILVGAYFGAISVGALFQQYDSPLFVLSLPLLFFTLVGVPLNLIFDFGLFFLLYLRGVATTKVVLFELAYDYIGVVAFFTRLLVQFVRLVLMFVVYFMMHEAVMVYQVGAGAAPFSGSTYADVFSLNWGGTSLTYFLTTTLPGQIGYWMYETVHTFFVVTAQIAAFGTIAFWLFLLFYSFFVFEKHENHFKFLRASRKATSF